VPTYKPGTPDINKCSHLTTRPVVLCTCGTFVEDLLVFVLEYKKKNAGMESSITIPLKYKTTNKLRERILIININLF